MLLQFLSLASGVHFTFLAFVLFRQNKQNNKSVKILIRLLLFMALYSTFVFYHYMAADKGLKVLLSYYLPIDGILLATLAPCLYYYVMATIKMPVSRNLKALLVHSIAFIPFIAFNIYFATLTCSQRVDWLLRDFQYGTVENNLLNAILYVQILLYLLVSYVQVKKKIKQTSIDIVDTETENYNWLKKYLLINLIYTLVSIPFCFYFANVRANIMIGQLAMNIQFVFLFFKITAFSPSVETPNTNPTKTPHKKQNQNIVDAQFHKLNTFITKNKPYLNELCSIQTLSEQTGIPQYQLTYIIHTKFDQTFPNYINQLRLQTAHDLLIANNSNLNTIETIAITCGFGSKSAFQRAFKKLYHQTPTEFIRQYRENN